MKTLLTIFILLTSMNQLHFDFGSNADGSDWVIINDGVMGGRSTSSYSIDENHLTFAGLISLENNGGFASLRSKIQDYDLSEFSTLKMRVRTYGRKFSIMLESSDYWWQPVLKYDFKTDGEEWQEFEIPLNEFKQYRVSQEINYMDTDKMLANTNRIGFILFDKKSGPFLFEIDYITFI